MVRYDGGSDLFNDPDDLLGRLCGITMHEASVKDEMDDLDDDFAVLKKQVTSACPCLSPKDGLVVITVPEKSVWAVGVGPRHTIAKECRLAAAKVALAVRIALADKLKHNDIESIYWWVHEKCNGFKEFGELCRDCGRQFTLCL